MKDHTIDAARWHIQIDPLPDRMLDRIRLAYEALIPFLHAHGFLSDAAFGSHIHDWKQFELSVQSGYEQAGKAWSHFSCPCADYARNFARDRIYRIAMNFPSYRVSTATFGIGMSKAAKRSTHL